MKPASSKAKYYQSKTPFEYLCQRTMIPFNGYSDCWIFIGPKDKDGYGQVQHSRVGKDLGVTRAHQMSWVMMNGPIPPKMCVCHTCDNPSCVNPKHLFIGTVADNNEDKRLKGRQKTGAKPNKYTKEILKLHGVKSSIEVAKEFGCSFSLVCQIWRKAGLYGRNH